MLERAASYEALVAGFRWPVPQRYNIGVDVCDRHAATRPHATALIYEDEAGRVERFSFGALRDLSNRFANALAALGLARGDRVGIYLPQAPETAIAHLAAYKAGLIAVPLFTLFGAEALEYRVGDCGAGGSSGGSASPRYKSSPFRGKNSV